MERSNVSIIGKRHPEMLAFTIIITIIATVVAEDVDTFSHTLFYDVVWKQRKIVRKHQTTCLGLLKWSLSPPITTLNRKVVWYLGVNTTLALVNYVVQLPDSSLHVAYAAKKKDRNINIHTRHFLSLIATPWKKSYA